MRSRTVVAALAIVAALGSGASGAVGRKTAPREDASLGAQCAVRRLLAMDDARIPRIGDLCRRPPVRRPALPICRHAGIARRRGLRAEFLDRATKMDPAALAPADRVSLRVFRYQLEAAAAQDKLCAPVSCGFDGYWSPVTQFDGPQFDLPQLVNATRFAFERRLRRVRETARRLPVRSISSSRAWKQG